MARKWRTPKLSTIWGESAYSTNEYTPHYCPSTRNPPTKHTGPRNTEETAYDSINALLRMNSPSTQWSRNYVGAQDPSVCISTVGTGETAH